MQLPKVSSRLRLHALADYRGPRPARAKCTSYLREGRIFVTPRKVALIRGACDR